MIKYQNANIQKELFQKTKAIEEKDKTLNELKGKLKELQEEMQIKESVLQSQQNSSVATHTVSEGKSESVTAREQKLLEQLEQLLKQSREKEQFFEEERLKYNKAYENNERKNRENMEKLKQWHENEKLVLNSSIFDKNREIEKLAKDIDEMRYNIRVSRS